MFITIATQAAQKFSAVDGDDDPNGGRKKQR